MLVNRNLLPSWINALIDRVADAPNSLIGRIAARRLGSPVPGTATTEFADAAVRVLIAPVNYSGQAYAWARALEKADPSISARNMAVDVPGGFSFDADLVVPVPVYHNDQDWQRAQFAAAAQATHILIEAEEPPFGRLLGRSVVAQVAALQDAGASIAYLAHGTDVRLPSRDMRDNPWSHYRDPEVYAPRYEVLAKRNIALLRASGRPLFVSTPDLLADVPEATWCPVVVDPARWVARRTASPARLRVSHAPSVSAVKGTQQILPALEKLAAEGLIDVDVVQGVPSSEMPAVFAASDIVIDQVRIGSYGVAACEAMASGCIVVGHVTDQVRTTVADLTDTELPIVEANPATIEQVLRDLIAGRDLEVLRERSRTFVNEVHDGRRSADALLSAWIRPTPEGVR